eukprot:gnl/MRDRNA2_/MRDRNA2_153542_c0_seq1.p1 gnl/MRDRNA2_/MRDRNA2_153542_c0~~gnl/MRDRNA2_/MRDRNA2_153542_c0_seq1.p1  ORF type:complete len:282 (-),score=42.57 gnl/MRDRNA2_/MRDRNA2_153542_c0_seq1:187-1032(-)
MLMLRLLAFELQASWICRAEHNSAARAAQPLQATKSLHARLPDLNGAFRRQRATQPFDVSSLRWRSACGSRLRASAVDAKCRQRPTLNECVGRRNILRATVAACLQLPHKAKADPADALAIQDAVMDASKDFANLVELAKEIISDGPSWSVEKFSEKRRAFVQSYIQVFVPLAAYFGTVLSLDISVFAFYLFVLNFSGVGYKNLQELTRDVPLIGKAINAIDSTLGNIAVALLLAEFTFPVLLPIGAKLAPSVKEGLEQQLLKRGWDPDSIVNRMEPRTFP